MSEENKKSEIDRPSPWEILGVIFAVFATIKDAPETLRKLSVPRLVPSCVRNFILEINASSDFWLSLFYLCTSIFLSTWILSRLRFKPFQEEDEEQDRNRKIVRYLQYRRFLRILHSFGLVLIREWILQQISVSWYETFKRSSNWPREESLSKYIDRVGFDDGRGIQFQYSDDFSKMILSEHPANDDRYGTPYEKMPQWSEVRILLIASNYFPFWFFVHLLKKLLNLAKNKCSWRKTV